MPLTIEYHDRPIRMFMAHSSKPTEPWWQPFQVLKPGGRDEAVTGDNRLQFVHLAAEWHLASRLGQPAEAFAQGLHEARCLRDWTGWCSMHAPSQALPDMSSVSARQAPGTH